MDILKEDDGVGKREKKLYYRPLLTCVYLVIYGNEKKETKYLRDLITVHCNTEVLITVHIRMSEDCKIKKCIHVYMYNM